MKSIWSTLYDSAKDRRYGVLFVVAPLAIFGAVGLTALLLAGLDHAGLLPYALLGIGLWLVFLFMKLLSTIVRFFVAPRRREKWERKELSRDEIRVARSKLVGEQPRKGA